MRSSEGPAIDPIESTLLRSHGVEISEHRLDLLALAVRTRRVRLLVLGDVLLTLEDRVAFRAGDRGVIEVIKLRTAMGAQTLRTKLWLCHGFAIPWVPS